MAEDWIWLGDCERNIVKCSISLTDVRQFVKLLLDDDLRFGRAKSRGITYVNGVLFKRDTLSFHFKA